MLKPFFIAVDPISEGLKRVDHHKSCARALCLPLNGVVMGAIKPLALPVISALGMLFFPIMAGIKSCQGKHQEARDYFFSWQACVLTAIASFGFLMMTGFVTPPKVSIGLMAAVMSVSIAFHLYRTERALH